MSPYRKKQVRRAILETLLMAKGYALENQHLQSCVDDMVKPALTDDEWKDAVTFLGGGEYMRRVAEDADVTLVQWAITTRGKTLLASI